MATKKEETQAVSMADVAALNGPAVDESAPPAVADPDASGPVEFRYADEEGGTPAFISEGMRHDVLTYGYAYDTTNRRRVERA